MELYECCVLVSSSNAPDTNKKLNVYTGPQQQNYLFNRGNVKRREGFLSKFVTNFIIKDRTNTWKEEKSTKM